ncbi:MAG: peptide ABC transporter ATP-binding protein [Zetaproteobacteria bacterium CG_4_9_14_3_um_filter_49_83]|nr:MAG: peptide ABC transporter ATP-binding protein [Zetaproteobacteria bacterium CG17_big_fil_post_rev_8_21_14_2_50_50_13]PIY57167.1 MAG: peptide ABC transporter ATP-binding protein [Zetaproteobacteria bacterium CG_4_10_14_0_8_um_filter_49_80]PJA34442.1 MAG: peptide ABC transporter ATP-binding protein [Zetaproteobacteria bacterium CG_4_9_14_3_um_filter_49_83]
MLSVEKLNKIYHSGGLLRRGQANHAVKDVSFHIAEGETVAIVGESGSGKSSVARLVMRLLPANSGQIHWRDQEVSQLSEHHLRPLRSHIQMVFQDPFASLNPRMRIWQSVGEGLRVHRPELSRTQRRDEVAEILALCGMDAAILDRYPHQFSGGQRQRIGIARALIVRPKVLVLDEPVSALDVSVQAQILNLLQRLQSEFNLSYLFISHDLSVVRHVADRVLVMFNGNVVEQGSVEGVFSDPKDAYTQKLLAARPVAHPSERR